MSERSVSVRLSATVAPYKAAMAEAGAATKKFESESGVSLQQLGTKMADVGKQMTMKVTLPLLAAGAVAVKLSMDFDSSMSKIVALVGIGADEVAGMKDAVLALAGETAKAPQELAEALFVLTSAGLRGQDALDALEMSAKASAAGLGATNDIARAVAGAMNAYGPGVLDAARATDILTATARAGNFETSQLAGALGRVLPFAKQAGASFEDVGGAVALLTRTNGDAALSITQVTSLLGGFVVPTAEAVTILGDLGMTMEDVRASIQDKGLPATLQMLMDKLGGNQEQLGKLVGGKEAASAAFAILDADAQSLADTFGVVTDSIGMTEDAFAVMTATSQNELKQAWIDVQIALIQVGEIIGPLVADVAGGISSIVGAFSTLPQGAQIAVVAFLGILAAVGPLLTIGGKILLSFQAITAGLVLVKAAMAAHPLLLLATVAATVGGALLLLSNKTDRTADSINEMADAMGAAESAGEGLAQWLLSTADRSDLLVPIMDAVGVTVSEVADAALEGGPAWIRLATEMAAAGDAAGLAWQEQAHLNMVLTELPGLAAAGADKAEMLARVTGETGDAADTTAGQVDGLTDAQIEFAEAADAAAQAQQDFIDTVFASVSSLFDYESSLYSLADANADLAQQEAETALILLDGTKAGEGHAQAMRDLREAQIGTAESALAAAEAFAAEQGAVKGSREAATLQIGELQRLKGVYPGLTAEIDLMIAELLGIPGTTKTISTVDTAAALLAIDGLQARINNVKGRTVVVNVDGSFRVGGSTVIGRFGGGPVKAGNLYEVGERNVAEMYMAGGRQYMIPGNDGQVIPGSRIAAFSPAQQMQQGPGSAGGGPLVAVGSIVTSKPGSVRRELDQWAWEAGMR